MHRFGFYLTLVSVAALALLTACGGAGSPVAPPAGVSAAAPAIHGGATKGYDGIVFVSDEDDNAVWICSANLGDIRRGFLPPSGQLNGVSDPAQMAVDAQGTLYVANAQTDASGAGEIAEYPRGTTSPARMLTTGLNTTTGVAVDSSGTVYASNKYWGSIVVFPKGKNAPSETIKKNLSGPDGLSVDKTGDLFIADSTANDVLELMHGSKTPQSLHLKGLGRPVGVALDRRGNLFVSNYLGASSNVTVYARGSTSPSKTIVVPGPPYNSESTIAEPMMLSVSNPGDVLIASAPLSLALIGGQEWFGYTSAIVGYLSGQAQPAWSVYNIFGDDSVFQPAK
jgi:sugar lactone lactonase YvrE